MKQTTPISSFSRLLRAFISTKDGLVATWKQQQAFRQEVYIALIASPVIVFLPVPAILKLLLILLFLFMTEIINSAIENTIDRISLEWHEKSKAAKDMGSAAVAMVIAMNVIAWLYTLFQVFM